MLEDDYEIDTAIDGLEGLQKIKDQKYDLSNNGFKYA